LRNTRRRCRFNPIARTFTYNLANALARIPGRLPEAIAEYQAALRIDPDFAEAHVNLTNTLARTPGGLPEAIAEYEAALRIRPDPQLRQIVDRFRAWRQQATPFR
jgi:tetratricopeptide (TPR) repeat protein